MFAESADQVLFDLHCLQKSDAKKIFRESILSEWQYKCCYCGRDANTIDHVRAKSKGGSSFRKNLVACCRRCNKSKAAEPVLEWYQRQSFYCQLREQRLINWIRFGNLNESSPFVDQKLF